MHGIRLITPAASEPLTLTDVKANLRISHAEHDGLLAAHIKQAREWVEQRVDRKLARQTWEMAADGFPTAEIKLPFVPIMSIESVKYDDEAGVEQTVDPADYWLDNMSRDHWLFPTTSWPTTLQAVNSVRIRFVAGYADYATVPAPLLSAIHLMVAFLYDGREDKGAIDRLLFNFVPMKA